MNTPGYPKADRKLNHEIGKDKNPVQLSNPVRRIKGGLILVLGLYTLAGKECQ